MHLARMYRPAALAAAAALTATLAAASPAHAGTPTGREPLAAPTSTFTWSISGSPNSDHVRGDAIFRWNPVPGAASYSIVVVSSVCDPCTPQQLLYGDGTTAPKSRRVTARQVTIGTDALGVTPDIPIYWARKHELYAAWVFANPKDTVHYKQSAGTVLGTWVWDEGGPQVSYTCAVIGTGLDATETFVTSSLSGLASVAGLFKMEGHAALASGLSDAFRNGYDTINTRVDLTPSSTFDKAQKAVTTVTMADKDNKSRPLKTIGRITGSAGDATSMFQDIATLGPKIDTTFARCTS